MWCPKQYLKKEIISALYVGGFDHLQIEFLGWLSNTAATLNNSRNPVKAAHTLWNRTNDPEERLFDMWETFVKRKEESMRPPDVPTNPANDEKVRALKDKIQAAAHEGAINAQGYKDLTKGGISDGGLPYGENEDEDAPEEGIDYV